MHTNHISNSAILSNNYNSLLSAYCTSQDIKCNIWNWLNLELGIETCFLGGRDEYVKSWLQLISLVSTWLTQCLIFLTALLTLLIFYLPYAFILTMGQWLQARSSRRLFYWINKPRVKPFLDAYHAPYKNKHRYWTGLLLCLRCALLLVFAFNTQADPSLSLLAISSVALGLMLRHGTLVLCTESCKLNILKASFIIKL